MEETDQMENLRAVSARTQEELEGEWTDIDRAAARVAVKKGQSSLAAKSLEDLVALGKLRGMTHPRAWAKHVIAARGK